MKYIARWVGMTAGLILWQFIYPPTVVNPFDASYWIACALFYCWMMDRIEQRSGMGKGDAP